MGRGISVGLRVVLAALLVAGTMAAASGPDADRTHVRGTVTLEAPTPEAVACAWQHGGDDVQGLVGWVIRLRDHEGDGAHVYRLVRDGGADLDVTFYEQQPSCDSSPMVAPEPCCFLEGAVPAGAQYAVLGRWQPNAGCCTYAIPPVSVSTGAAVAVSFDFRVVDAGDGHAPPPFDDDPATTERLAAGLPDLTVAISRARFDIGLADHAVLARMDVAADALAAAPLTRDGPLLGVWHDGLPPEVADELFRAVGAGGTVYVLGGNQSISPSVEKEIERLGYVPRRLAGATRIGTALAVADEVRSRNPEGGEVLLAQAYGNGSDPTSEWADAVAGGGWAASSETPILLTDSDQLHPSVGSWIQGDDPRRTILLGGSRSLSAAVENAVPNPNRIAGPDRAATAAAIARELWRVDDLASRRAVIINGWARDGWLGGLAAAGVSALYQAPLLVVSGGGVPGTTASLVSACGHAQVDILVAGTSPDPGHGVTEAVIQELDDLDGRDC